MIVKMYPTNCTLAAFCLTHSLNLQILLIQPKLALCRLMASKNIPKLSLKATIQLYSLSKIIELKLLS